MSTISYVEAIVIGGLQGITELFPVSSRGHSMIIPALIGGWATDLSVATPESSYLAFVVGLHVATAAALLVFFWRDWVRIVGGFVSSIRYRRISTDGERLAWHIVLATIPVGLAGLLLEHLFRTVLGRPMPAAAFLFANGLILLLGERLRRRATPERVAVGRLADTTTESHHRTDATSDAQPPEQRHDPDDDQQSDARFGPGSPWSWSAHRQRPDTRPAPRISRSGVTMVAGLTQGRRTIERARPGKPQRGDCEGASSHSGRPFATSRCW